MDKLQMVTTKGALIELTGPPHCFGGQDPSLTGLNGLSALKLSALRKRRRLLVSTRLPWNRG